VTRAREAERRRIAGEMHDVLAHRLSLLALHAGALEFRDDILPKALSDAAGVVRASAYTALEELSQVIGILRHSDDSVVPPQPTLAQVPALVEESRAAKLRVACRIDVTEGAAVPAAIERTAYRIVQEGLTNARKHAPEHATVNLTIASADLRCLTVVLISRSPLGALRAPPPPGGGSGLIGLSERVALAGGRLQHGLDPDGSFALRATLPWPP
jgi:signal transduction histidine kinase